MSRRVPYPGFVGGSYTSQSPTASQERTMNWYVQPLATPAAKARAALYPTPGVSLFTTASTAPVRGLFAQNGRLFAAVGAVLYEIASDGTVTSRGALAYTDAHPVIITANGEGGGQLFITASGVGYNYDLGTNTLTAVIGSGARMCAMLDGFFLVLDESDSTLSLSDLFDGLTFDPTQFEQRSTAPDLWRSLLVARKDIWLFGDETSDVYYNAGTAPFPFQPYPGGLVPYGIAAPDSAAEISGTVIWLARTAAGSGDVVAAVGASARSISAEPLLHAIENYAQIDDAIGETYEDQGHAFYVLTFPAANATWVYDLTTGIWCERGTWIAEENRYVAWRPLFHAFVFGKHLVGDRASGAIYEMSTTFYADVESRPLRRVRRAPSLFSQGRQVGYAGLELCLEAGLGAVSGQGSDPQVELRFSNDGGKTWQSAGLRSAGPLGEYSTRVQWGRLGAARDRVFEIVVTDPIPWRIVDAYLDLREAA